MSSPTGRKTAAEPLLAIADVAGGDWPTRARDTLVGLALDRDVSEGTIGVRLLADIRAIFDDPAIAKLTDVDKGDGLASGDLAAALAEIEGTPWAEWGRKEKPITATALARCSSPTTSCPASTRCRVSTRVVTCAPTSRTRGNGTPHLYKVLPTTKCYRPLPHWAWPVTLRAR